MKGGTQAALALGVGYMLGRRRKLRRVAILAAVTATGRMGGVSKMLVGRGLKAVGSTELIGKLGPQLGDIAETARGELLEAGKTAAMAAVSKQVDSLSDSLRTRADVLSDPTAAGGIADALRGGRGGRGGRDGERGEAEADGERDEYRSQRDGDEDRYEDEYGSADYESDQYDDEYEPEDAEAEDDYAAEDDYEADDEEPAEDEEPATPPRRRRAGVTSSPVSRTGR